MIENNFQIEFLIGGGKKINIQIEDEENYPFQYWNELKWKVFLLSTATNHKQQQKKHSTVHRKTLWSLGPKVSWSFLPNRV